MFNVLGEQLIRFDSAEGARLTASLPGTYAALMIDDVQAFPSLRPHQRHAWHAFLVQLGAMAMDRAGVSEPPLAAAEWAAMLRGLTSQYAADEPWQLVVDDITRPALLQPPASSAEHQADYKHGIATPDELDMLLTSKNHDLKAAVAHRGGPEDWMFALITLQTMGGLDGRDTYGISRMNRGYGNRPAFSLAPVGGPGAHVRRDLASLLAHRPALLNSFPMIRDGETLLWTIPWDGARDEALLPTSLDPCYIEVCRRVRLQAAAGGGLRGVRATSKATRIEARELNGRTGDPWTPVNEKVGKSLTLSSGGFTYKRMTEYLTSADWERPALLKPTVDEQASGRPMRLVARAIVRGQGKTEGYHERVVPLRRQALRSLGGGAREQDVGTIARERIAEIAIVQRILSHSIQVFLAGGDPERISPEQRERARPWLNRLDAIVDAGFFDALQTELEAAPADRPGVRREWLLGVVGAGREMLQDAADTLPCRAIRRYRARTRAESLFEGRMRGPKGLPSLFSETDQ